MTRVIVMGAGIIGMTSAYELSRLGFEVTVIDRASSPAQECSYANGGQLSYGHAEPWANPYALKQMLPWLCKKNSPISVALRYDPALWIWLISFFRNCSLARTQENSRSLLHLAYASKEALQRMTTQTGAAYHQSSKGTLHLFSQQDAFDAARAQASFQESLGCSYEILNGHQACINKESTLVHSKEHWVGGLYFPDDASGDANLFAQGLHAYLAKQSRVHFSFGTRVHSIKRNGNHIACVKTDQGDISADHYVMALGAEAPLLLRPLDIKIPVYPMKGYSLTIPVPKDFSMPNLSLTEHRYKVVITTLGNTLRIAGMADLRGYDYRIHPSRITALENITHQLFPQLPVQQASPWTCLRPATPNGLPIIGKTHYDNLFLNTGHGTLGWTLACGSAEKLGTIMTNKL